MDFKVFKLSIPLQKKPQLSKKVFSLDRKQHNSKTTLRFQKNKNIVESNKQNIDFNYQAITQKLQNDSSTTSKQNSINQFPRSIKTQRSTIRTSHRISILPNDQKTNSFYPQIKSEIIKKHQNDPKTYQLNRAMAQNKTNKIYSQDKMGLKKLLAKNNISGVRCLMGKNIPKIQEIYAFSRFELFNLYTYYKTLLEASKQSVKMLKKGFQSIMYMNKIELNSQMIERMFAEFFSEISFENFMKVYGNIQNLLFTQNITDFMTTVFCQFYKEEYMNEDKVLQALKKRLQETQAMEIKKLLFQFYSRRESQDMIQVKQILNACSQNSEICRIISNGMKKQPAVKQNAKDSADKK